MSSCCGDGGDGKTIRGVGGGCWADIAIKMHRLTTFMRVSWMGSLSYLITRSKSHLMPDRYRDNPQNFPSEACRHNQQNWTWFWSKRGKISVLALPVSISPSAGLGLEPCHIVPASGRRHPYPPRSMTTSCLHPHFLGSPNCSHIDFNFISTTFVDIKTFLLKYINKESVWNYR